MTVTPEWPAERIADLTTLWNEGIPTREPRAPGFRTCGDPVRLGKPYCAEHYRVAYRRG